MKGKRYFIQLVTLPLTLTADNRHRAGYPTVVRRGIKCPSHLEVSIKASCLFNYPVYPSCRFYCLWINIQYGETSECRSIDEWRRKRRGEKLPRSSRSCVTLARFNWALIALYIYLGREGSLECLQGLAIVLYSFNGSTIDLRLSCLSP